MGTTRDNDQAVAPPAEGAQESEKKHPDAPKQGNQDVGAPVPADQGNPAANPDNAALGSTPTGEDAFTDQKNSGSISATPTVKNVPNRQGT